VVLRNSAGEAPLYIAALRGEIMVVDVLLQHMRQEGIRWQVGIHSDDELSAVVINLMQVVFLGLCLCLGFHAFNLQLLTRQLFCICFGFDSNALFAHIKLRSFDVCDLLLHADIVLHSRIYRHAEQCKSLTHWWTSYQHVSNVHCQAK